MPSPSSIDRAVSGPSSLGRRSGPGRYLCVFRMEESRYAVDATLVSEVFSVARVSAVPLRPAWLLGLHNLRGTPLPVVELRSLLLGASLPRPIRGAMHVIAFQNQDIHVGGRVDRVESVRPWAGATEAQGEASALVRSLLRFEGDPSPVALLDEDRLFGALQLTRASTHAPTPFSAASHAAPLL